MAFQTLDFMSIVAGAINWLKAATKKLTDYRTGSVVRTMIEAPSIEIDELYQQMVNGLNEAIPTSLYLAFNFGLLDPAEANGPVLFSIPAPRGTNTLISGAVVTSSDGSKIYTQISDVTIPAGQTSISADVSATVAGTIGNCGVGDISIVTSGPSGLTVTNLVPFTNGRDKETPSQRQLRFQQYVASLSRGPLGSIQYGATTVKLLDANGVVTEYVSEAIAVEQYRLNPTAPLGRVDVYIYNGGSGASTDLVAAAQDVVNGVGEDVGYKGAGVVAEVSAAALQFLSVPFRARTSNGKLTSDQKTQMTAELNAAILANPIGHTLDMSTLSAAGQKVTGIIGLTALIDDVVPDPNVKLIPSVFTFPQVTS